MNIKEIREKYPQYGNISDKELAERLHQKYYKDMDFADFSQRIGYKAPVQNTPLPPLSPELRAQPRGNYWQGVPSAFGEGFEQGLLSGTESALNGATLGGYGWLNRKLGGEMDKRRQELQALAGNEGLGSLNLTADFAAGLGGGLGGVPRATAALGSRLLGSRLWSLPAYAASGAADAGILSAFDNDFTNSEAITQDALEGGLMGGLLGTAGNMALKPLSKVFSAKELTKGKKGGLNNVVDNPDAVKIVRRGIGASDNVAQEFMNKVPAAARRINSETADMINNSLNRRIDVPRTVASQKQKYRDFMEANAGNEVLDFSELLPEVHRYRGKDNLSVLKSIRRNLQKTEPEFKFRLDEQGNYDYPHFLKDSQRQQYVHSLASTYRFPDKIVDGINDNQNRQYLLKTFYNPDNQKAVYDVGVLNSDGTLLTKFAREGRKGKTTTENILKKGIARTSTGGTTLTPSQMGAAPSLNVRLNNTINPNGLVVNPELPHYLTLYEGLTPYQVKSLNSAVKRGSEKTTNKLGTLDSMNRIKQELNDDIMKSKVPDEKNSLNLVDTSDTKQLREVKQRIDRTLGDALKGRDKGYRKAKSMDEAYNAGRRYNPNAVGNDALIPSLPPLERNAFTQGLFQRMTHNPLTGSNLANDALKYENALSGVLPPSRYDALMDGLNRQNVRYNRLAQLGGRAQNKLVMPEKDGFFGREQLESKGATLGAGLDWVNEALRGRAYEQAAKNLLDPDFVGTEGSWLMENYPTLSAYLSGMFAAE